MEYEKVKLGMKVKFTQTVTIFMNTKGMAGTVIAKGEENGDFLIKVDGSNKGFQNCKRYGYKYLKTHQFNAKEDNLFYAMAGQFEPLEAK